MHMLSIHLGPLARNRLLRAAQILVAAIVAFTLLGFFVAPAIVKTYVANKLGEEIGRKLEFGEVHINPFALSATVRNITLYEADQNGRMLTVGEVYLNASAASLLRLAPVIAEIRVEQPVAHIVRSSQNRFNFSDIVDKILAQPESGAGTPTFSLHNMHLRQGRVDYDDQYRQSRHSLSEIDLALPFLSNLKSGVEIFTKPAFSAKLDGSPLAISGQTRPFAATRDTALQIDLNGLSLPEYMALSPVPLNFKLESGLLDTRLNLDFHQSGATGSVIVSGHAVLRQVQLQEKSGAPLLQWEHLTLELERFEPFNRLLRIAALKLESPTLHASRRPDGSLNLVRAFAVPAAAAESAAAQPASATKPMLLALKQAEIAGAQVHWRDGAAGPGDAAALDIRKLDATLTDFSSDGSKQARLKAALETDAAETLHYDAILAADGRSLQGELQIASLRPQRLQPYFAAVFAGNLGNTLLDASLPHRLAWPDSGLLLTLQQASAHLRNLQLTLPGEKAPAAIAREVAVTGLQFNLAKRDVSADQLTIDGAKLVANRNQSGDIDLLTLLAGPPVSKRKAAAPKAPGAPTGGWQASLKHLQLTQSELRFSDARVAPQNGGKPAVQRFDKVDLALENIVLHFGPGASVARPAPIPLSLKATYNQSGTLSAKGTLNLRPLGTDLQIDGQRLEITGFQPYFADRSNASISRGALNASGKLMLQLPEQQPRIVRASYTGKLSLTGVRTRDRISGDDFARWKSLSIGNLDAQYNTRKNPLQVSLGNVALSDFYARIIINPNGRLNLQDIVANPEQGQAAPTVSLTQTTTKVAPVAAPAAAKAAGPEPLIRIGQVTLQGGNINFSDNFIKPNYSANLTNMTGAISKVASDDQTPADVLLKGKLDGDAPVEVTGKLNPLGRQLYLDLTGSARGVELTRLTAYAAKYAGYPITKGKLSVDVKYHVENGKLDAQNKLFLDQLTFGDKVDGPSATKLPVLLAVALLRNSRGEIDVNLPVSGSLSDPEFSIGGVILRVIGNLLTKAITAPFSLLASAFGGGEELSHIEFAPGTSSLSADAIKKLETLAKALNDRSGLKLEITGRIDPESDRDGVRRAYVERRLRLQKLEDLRNQGSAIQMREVTVQPDEYAKYLTRAYKAEKFPKPRNVLGLAKSLPPEEMEKLMLANAPVGDTELKALADNRALAAKRFLEQEGKVANERMFLTMPELSAAGIKDGGKPNRVEFAVKR